MRGGMVGMFILLSGIVFCQKSINVTVLDAQSTLPLSDASVSVTSLTGESIPTGGLTADNGKYTLKTSLPIALYVSYIGYQPYIDTLREAANKIIYLKPTAASVEDIVVTGQYSPSAAKNSLYQVKVLNEKDIRSRGATNLKEVLQGNLNIDIAQDNVFGAGLSLQGISGEGVKIMIDGVPLVGRLDGKLDLSQINLSNIARIEIVKGPMNVMYGTDAMGGVVNLITKTNQLERYNINLKGYYESVGQYNQEINAGVNLGKSQIYMSGGRNFFEGISLTRNSRHKDWRGKEQYFATAKYTYGIKGWKVGASASYFQELMLDRGNLKPFTTYAFDQHYLTRRIVASAFATLPIKQHSQVDILLGYSGFIRFFNYYSKDLTTLTETLRTDQLQDTTIYHAITGRATYTFHTPSSKISLQSGLDINQEFTTQTLIKGTQQIGDNALFASMRWRPTPSLAIQPAARYSYNSKFRTFPIPSINIKWEAPKYLSIRASYALGLRNPSLKELYLNFKDSNHDINGNTSLRQELGQSSNLTIELNLNERGHRVKWTSTAFYNYIKNKIDLVAIGGTQSQVTYQYQNINSYTTAGGESVMDYGYQRFHTTVGASYIYYKTDIEANIYTLISPDVSLQLGYQIPKAEVGINLIYKYTGSKLLYSLAGSTYKAGLRDPYHSLDVSFSRNFWKDRIQLTTGGKNLFNVTNIYTSGAVASGHNTDGNSTLVNWGRSFFISLTLHYAK